MQRVMIIGGSGSGKSTTAIKLGEITGLPVVHIDPMYWKPGWVWRDEAETRAMVLAVMAQDTWIFDGNHHRTSKERLTRADHLIYMDISTLQRLWRVILRTFKNYHKSRADMPLGCPENFEWRFLRRVVGYYRRRRARDIAVLNTAPAHVKCYHIKRNADLEQLYKDVQP
ncbi:MAG: AAA family ATPase [Paracoccaceae bacterium]